MATVREIRALFTAETKGIQKAFQQIRQEAAKLGPETKRTTDQVNKNYDGLISSTEKLEKAIKDSGDPDAFDDLNKAIKKSQDEMSETGKVSSSTMAELNRAVQGSVTHLDSLGDEARGSFGEIEDAINEVNRDFRTLGVNNGLAELNQDIGRTEGELDNLGSAATTAEQNISDVGSENQLDELNRDSDRAGDGLSTLSDSADAADRNLSELGGDNNLDTIGREVGGAEGSLRDLESVADRTDRSLEELGDSGLDSVERDSDRASGGLEDVEDAAQNAGRRVDDLEGEFDGMGDTASSETSIAGNAIGSLGKAAIGIAGAIGAVFAVDKIKDFAFELAETAGSAQAVSAQFSTVFGDMEDEASEKLGAISGEASILENRMKESFAKIAAFAKTGGMDTAESLDLADRSMRAIADSAAFYDKSLEDTTESLQSFLKGNFENDAALGLSATETTRNAAANDLYGKSFIDLSEAQKQLTLLQMVEDANKVSGAFGQAARESEGWENVTGNMAQAWKDFKAEIGEPVLEIAVEGFVWATEQLQKVDTEKIASGISAITSTASTLFGTLKTAFGALKAFLSGDESAVDVLMSYGLDPDKFDKIVKFGNLLQENLSKIREVAAVVFERLSIGFNTLKDNALPILNSIVTTFLDVFNKIMPIVQPALGAVVGFIGDQIGKIVQFWNENGAQIMTAVSKVFNGIMAVINFVMPAVLGIIKMVWGNIKGVISGALDVIMGLVKVFSGLFTGDFSKMWEGIKQVFSGAVEFLWNFIQLTFYGKILGGAKTFILAFRSGFASMWNAVKALFTEGGGAALAFLKRAWDEMWTATKTIFTNIGTFLKDTWNSIKSIFNGTISAIKTIFTTGWNAVRTTTSTVFNAIKTFITALWNGIKTFFTTSINTFKTLFQNGWNTISTTTRNVFNAIWNFLKSIFTTIKNFISTTVNNILTTIRNIWNSILNTTKSVFNGIWNFIKGIFTDTRNYISTTVSGILTKIKDTWNAVKTTTSNAFRDVFNSIKTRFTDIVNAAKALPQRIGDGIGSMASKVKTGVTKVVNSLAATLGKGVNGVIGGINWVLGKIGVDKKNHIDKWTVPKYAQGTLDSRKGHPGGLAMVNDGKGNNSGPEMIQEPDGSTYMLEGKDVVTNLPKGSTVWSAKKTKEMLKMIPHYDSGTMDTLKAAGGYIKDKWNSGKEKVKEIGGKVKDVVVNALDYVKSPGKLLDLALKTLGIQKPDDDGFIGKMAVGGWNQVKDAAIDYVKGKLSSFASTQSGIALTGGNGGGFGAPFRLTSKPGPRNTGIPGASTYHKGWDWAAPIGTPIPSVSDGVVSRTGYNPISGNFIEVRSGNKVHRYQHNSRNALSWGQDVRKGQTVGYVGNTGITSGPHLHYELKGYEDGGIVDTKQLAWIAEGGWAESIISHDPAKRVSQRAIWEETGKELGFDKETMARMPIPSGDLIIKLQADGRDMAEVVRPWIDVLQGGKNSGNSFMRG